MAFASVVAQDTIFSGRVHTDRVHSFTPSHFRRKIVHVRYTEKVVYLRSSKYAPVAQLDRALGSGPKG